MPSYHVSLTSSVQKLQQVDNLLVATAIHQNITFPVNDVGLPTWVSIDARKASPDQVSQAVRQFGDALWGASTLDAISQWLYLTLM